LNPFLLQFSDILLEVLDILSVLLFLLLQALSVVVKLLLLVLFLFCLGSSVSDFDFEFRDGLALLVDLVGDFVVVLLKITVLGFVNGKLFQLFLVKLFELIELILLLTKNAVFFELVLHGGLLLELLDLFLEFSDAHHFLLLVFLATVDFDVLFVDFLLEASDLVDLVLSHHDG
jgi:hypothetical protein